MSKPVLTIKHNVVAITLDRDLHGNRGDVLIVPVEGDAQPVVMPGTSFALSLLGRPLNGVNTEKVTPVKVKKPRGRPRKRVTASTAIERASKKPTWVSKNLARGHLTPRELKYMQTISTYSEPISALELSVLLSEDYGIGGNFQSNILRPLFGAGYLHREKGITEIGNRNCWTYRITALGQKVVADNGGTT